MIYSLLPKIVNSLTSENAAKDLEKDEEEVLDESNEENSNNTGKGRKSTGRESPWTQEQLNDLIDIILENEEYKKYLIFRNT